MVKLWIITIEEKKVGDDSYLSILYSLPHSGNPCQSGDQQRKKVQGKLVADTNEVSISFWPAGLYLILNSSR